MSIASELRAAIAANAAETKRIAEKFDALKAEADALKTDKAALAEKVAQAEVERQASAAELAELKSMVEGDTADEAKIGAATSGGSTGGITD